MRHDLMLNEYQQEFVDFVMKISRSNCPIGTTYQGMAIILHFKGICKKFRHIGNFFNIRTIFRTKHTLQGTLMETGPVRDAHQMKQCVYNTLRDFDRCCIRETTMALEVCIKEHKYNLTQHLSENFIFVGCILLRCLYVYFPNIPAIVTDNLYFFILFCLFTTCFRPLRAILR
jgi:hypothetical protein